MIILCLLIPYIFLWKIRHSRLKRKEYYSMNEQDKSQEETNMFERQKSEQHIVEGRQLKESQLREEVQRQETQRMLDEQRRQDSQRQENKRREDEHRREEERHKQEQRVREVQQKQENQQIEKRQRTEQPRELGEESPLHESTVRTMQGKDGRSHSEQSSIEYAQKHGVPIAPATLSMSGRSQSESKTPHGEKPEPTEQKKTVKAQEATSPQKGGFAARREALKDKVQENLKAQEKGKMHDLGHDR